jgi:hypothetical protein
MGSAHVLHPAASALDPAISRAGVALSHGAGLRRLQAAASLVPGARLQAASAQSGRRACSPASPIAVLQSPRRGSQARHRRTIARTRIQSCRHPEQGDRSRQRGAIVRSLRPARSLSVRYLGKPARSLGLHRDGAPAARRTRGARMPTAPPSGCATGSPTAPPAARRRTRSGRERTRPLRRARPRSARCSGPTPRTPASTPARCSGDRAPCSRVAHELLSSSDTSPPPASADARDTSPAPARCERVRVVLGTDAGGSYARRRSSAASAAGRPRLVPG